MSLKIQNLSFKYNHEPILKDINLCFDSDSHISLIGESGCGKSTLLKLIYGLLDPSEGSITWNGTPIKGTKNSLIPGEQNMKLLNQDFDLMKFSTVKENIGKYLSNQDLELRNQRIFELLEMVEMTKYADIQPKYLSGGQQQRIALARTLAQEPEILILDEPFSNIDNFRKNTLRRNLFSYLRNKKILCIIASHDFSDALSFSDKIIVMKNGEIIENNNPKEIYENPKNKYIANLFDDVNSIKTSYFSDQNNIKKEILLYPHELIPVENSNLKVQVIESFFKGNGYLVQSIYEDGIIFFYSNHQYFLGEELFLNVSSKILEKRIN